MPDCAIYNNRLIRASDINKYIDKNNDFTCYTCGKNLYFNEIYNTVGENSSNHETIKYTEYVFNFIHDKHDKHDNHDNNNSNQSIIDSDYKLCEINTYKKITQHKCIIFSNIIKYDYKNIIKLDDKYKHLFWREAGHQAHEPQVLEAHHVSRWRSPARSMYRRSAEDHPWTFDLGLSFAETDALHLCGCV